MLTALPPQLAAWSAELEQLPAELALGLYPLIARLASALGPLSSEGSGRQWEPEGYGGLSRRGPYHRLLSSEWLLALELPEEFERRAANAEHLFFELASRHGSGARRALVLFDAGPEQLGAARLVHLAALVVFARRARAAGAALHWGVLQAPEAGLAAEVSRAGIERLLRARSADVASETLAVRWQLQIGALRQQDDAWVIGGARLRELGALGSWPRIVLQESIDPDLRIVDAELEHPARARMHVRFDLPEPDHCVQLLRDPYRSARATPPRVRFAFDLQRTPWFSGDGRRVFAWLRDGGVVSFPVPNSPRAKPGKPRVFRPAKGETLVAAGSLGRKTFALTLRGHELFMHGGLKHADASQAHSRRAVTVAHAYEQRADWSDRAQWAPGVLVAALDRIRFVNALDEFFVLDDPNEARLTCFGRATAMSAWREGTLRAQLSHHADGSALSLDCDGPSSKIAHQTLRFDGARAAVHVGCHYVGIHVPPNQVGIRMVPSLAQVTTLVVPSRSHLCGVVAGPSLLVLEADRRTLSSVGTSSSTSYERATTAIAGVGVSTGSHAFAYLSEGGELVVHLVAHQAPVLRVVPEAGA